MTSFLVQLERLVREVIREEIRVVAGEDPARRFARPVDEPNTTQPMHLLTAAEIAPILGISVQRVYELSRRQSTNGFPVIILRDDNTDIVASKYYRGSNGNRQRKEQRASLFWISDEPIKRVVRISTLGRKVWPRCKSLAIRGSTRNVAGNVATLCISGVSPSGRLIEKSL